jgi:phosphoglycerate dehydrogenase-like enzyme
MRPTPPPARPTLAFALDPSLTPDLVTDEIRARLHDLCAVICDEAMTEYASEKSRGLLSQAEILFTGWGAPVIDAAVLAFAPSLRLVAHTGSSVKLVASPEVWRTGIAVVSAAEANATPVAEYALAAILLANKKAFSVRERYRDERRAWRLPWVAPGETGNFGAVVGIIGASRIGRRLLQLLTPFDLNALVFDPFLSSAEAEALGAEKVELHELMSRSDVVTLHAPVLPETLRMIGRAELAMMRDGSTLLNTARGALIDEEALVDELRSGRIAAILDVSDPEPPSPASPLFDLPNVFLTPHIAGAAGRETQRMAELATDEIQRFVSGKPLRHRITADMLARIG